LRRHFAYRAKLRTMVNTEQLLTPKQLAEIAGVSAATIKREVARGRLRGLRIGEQALIRIPMSAWNDYVEHAANRRNRRE
jgi:excisionase family DNA binding protein